MMARRSADNLLLIKELCNRLGFSGDSAQLDSERCLRSLLPQIQQRLNNLQEEDTYGNVDEIPTDSCPVVYAGPVPRMEEETFDEEFRKNSVGDSEGKVKEDSEQQDGLSEEKLRRALSSIVRSAVSAQIREILARQTGLDDRGSAIRSNGSISGARLKEGIPMSSVLSEIRNETLLKEVMMSAVQAASEEALASFSANCSLGGSKGNFFPTGEASFISASNADEAVARWSDFRSDLMVATTSAAGSGSAYSGRRPLPTITALSSPSRSDGSSFTSSASLTSAAFSAPPSTAPGSSHGGVACTAEQRPRVAFSGFPCYPSPRRCSPALRSQSSWPSAYCEAPLAPLTATSNSSGWGGYGEAKVRDGYAGAAVTVSGENGSIRWQSRWPQEPESDAEKLGSSEDDEGEADDEEDLKAWGLEATEDDELMSFSNRKGVRRLRRRLRKRRRNFCWAIEDIYQLPYEGVESVARDNWRFVKDRASLCPPFAQLNRVRREEIVSERTRAERTKLQKRKKSPGSQLGSARWSSSPLELFNGVNHPAGPTMAPCRAAFVGGY